MDTIGELLLTAAVAGAGGMGLGGLLGALFKKESGRSVGMLLSFAAGVMTSIVCFDLILDAIETNINIFAVIFSIMAGAVIIYLLHNITEARSSGADHSLFMAGAVTACAIAVHNVPEGMTIGASYAGSHGNIKAIFVLGLLIGIHNVPAGMAISVPLISGGMAKEKAILLTALSGTPTIIGAAIGYLIGDLGSLGLALSLSFAGGSMLYVIFGELLPESAWMCQSKRSVLMTILGILTGLLLIYH